MYGYYQSTLLVAAGGSIDATAHPIVVVATTSIPQAIAGTARSFTSATTSVQATGLTPGRTYRAKVRARDAAGNWSAYSGDITFTTPLAPATVAAATSIPTPTVTAPASVTKTPATVTAATSVPTPTVAGASSTTRTPATVTATASIPTPGAGLQRILTTAATSLQATGLLPSTRYAAKVRARDAAGNWSAYSDPVFFTTGMPAQATVNATVSIPTPTVGGTPATLTALSRPVITGQTVLLDVTATPAGGSTITGHTWAITAGGGSLTNPSTATPTFNPPGSGSGLTTVRATVYSSNGGTATTTLTVSYGPNIVAAENALAGTVRSTWDLTSPNLGGVSTLQGFCDGFTIDRTGTASFKIGQSDSAGWSAEVYRLGYYGGDGARSYGTLTPSGAQLTASQAQPTPGDADTSTTLLSADCSNWSATLTWTPPAWAPSGMYVLRLNRTGGGASHVMFVVRDDARHADLMLMPADSTWNAYNAWGGLGSGQYTGNSLYYGAAVDQYNADCARYVSYNRPVVNRGAADSGRSYGAVEWSTFFTGEYPMVRFLERNGVDVKYYGCIDAAADSSGTHLTGNGTTRGGAGAAMFVGHNEYWSTPMRSGWEAARDAGVNLFSCAGNEVFWRIAGSNADADGRPRTFECQKSTIGGRGNTRPEWTGSWRDPDGAGKGGNNPENRLTGTIFVVNGPDLRSLVVPFAGGYSAQPIWRHTTAAALTTGQTWSSPAQILGFEWDTYGPAGTNSTAAAYMAAPHPRTRFLSDVTYSVSSGLLLTDAGDEYLSAGTATHRLVVYPGGNGGIVFGTGTVNWALGVDDANTYQQGSDNTSLVIQQATINMLVDMGANPATLMGTLTAPTAVDWFVDALPDTVTATTSIPAPGVVAGASRAPGTVTASAAIPAPTVSTAAISLRAQLNGTFTGTTVTVTLPAYTTTDYIVLVVGSNNGNAKTFSSNVTATDITNAGNRMVAHRIVPQDGSQTSFTFTVAASSVFTWWIASYTGVDLAATVYGANTATGNSTNSLIAVPQVELPYLATGKEMVFSAAGVNSTATWTTAADTIYNTTTGNAAIQVRATTATAGHLTTTPAGMDRGNAGSSRNQNAVAFSLQPVQSVVASKLVNGSFESGTSVATGWEIEGSITGTPAWTVQSAAGVYDGAKAQKGVYAGQPGDAGTALAVYQAPIPAAPGEVLEFSVWLSGSQVNCSGIVGIEGFTSGNVYISESDTSVSLTGTATRYTVTYTCPAGTDHVAVYVQFNEVVPTTALTVQADQATLFEVTDPGAATRLPVTVAGSAAIPAPTITVGVVRQPATVAATAVLPAPAAQVGVVRGPATVAAIGAVPAPVVSGGSSVTASPTTVAATTTVPVPAVTAASSAVRNPATVTVQAAIPAPATAGAAATSPATVTATTAVPAPAVTGTSASTSTPATVSAVASIPAPTAQVSQTATPAVVAATTAVPAPAVGVSTVVHLTTVGGVAAIASPAIVAQAYTQRTPTTVMALATVPTPGAGAVFARRPGILTAGTTRSRLSAGTLRGTTTGG